MHGGQLATTFNDVPGVIPIKNAAFTIANLSPKGSVGMILVRADV